jgi:hypothetical protein
LVTIEAGAPARVRATQSRRASQRKLATDLDQLAANAEAEENQAPPKFVKLNVTMLVLKDVQKILSNADISPETALSLKASVAGTSSVPD